MECIASFPFGTCFVFHFHSFPFTQSLAAQLISQGRQLLQEVEEEPRAEGAGGATADVSSVTTNLQFQSLTLSNFGCFEEPFTYPLRDRGLVLIKGSAEDSNGAGKTTLAMAPYWALTGSTDTRLAGDSRVGDIVFDSGDAARAKKSVVASVELRGLVNGQPFAVLRRKPRSRGGSLRFTLGGEDLSRQTLKDTQVGLWHGGEGPPVCSRTHSKGFEV